MELSCLQFSPKISVYVPSMPSILSYKSSTLLKPRFSLEKSLSFSTELNEKTDFLGKSLNFGVKSGSLGDLRNTHVRFIPVRAAVKRRKELPFDNVIQRDKKLKLVLKIRKILVSQPERIMPLRELGKFRRALGIDKKRRFIALLKKFPSFFEIVEEGIYSLRFRMTDEAERLYLEELRVRNEMEDLLVVKLRKLLMMSLEKRILLEKIAHLKNDLGLPLEFRSTICQRYPQYFRVIQTERGPALELTHWDPELAVSFAELEEEENRAKEIEEQDLIIDRPPKFNRVKLPKGLKLSKGEMGRINRFRGMPYISPYEDFSAFSQGSAEKEKHACGVVHEILSLTIEKRTLVDHFTHFREEFRFSQQLRGMLIRHPDMFYVSLKGDRDSVFLREAYHDSHLVEKNRLLLIKEKLRSLVNVPRFSKRGASRDSNETEGGNEVEDGTGGEEDDDWSELDNIASDGSGDEEVEADEEYEDEWSDEDDDDDMPPDFDEDDGNLKPGSSKQIKEGNRLIKDEGKVLVPTFPDGRPRERCCNTMGVQSPSTIRSTERNLSMTARFKWRGPHLLGHSFLCMLASQCELPCLMDLQGLHSRRTIRVSYLSEECSWWNSIHRLNYSLRCPVVCSDHNKICPCSIWLIEIDNKHD